jgi:MFS family permease
MDRIRSRRRFVVGGALFQACVWIPILLVPWLLGRGSAPVMALLGLLLLYHGANGALVPVWNSLIGDLVPADIRGRFFGNRNRLTGMSTFLGVILAGATLNLFERSGRLEVGFMLIFAAAFCAKMISVFWLTRYEDPPAQFSPDQVFSFRQFLRRSPHSNFAKFVFFVAAINLGVAFSAPYFALYMLRDLGFSYLEFTAVTGTAVITQFLTFRYWGELADRFGTKKILNLCGLGVSLVPALWLFSSHIAYLIVIQVYGGAVWAGFSLAAGNFIFDAVTPPKRARCVAYYGLVNGVFVFAGSTLGGLIAGHLPTTYHLGPWTWTPLFTLPVIFLISGCMRLLAAAIFLPRFREVRPVEPIGHRELIFRVSHLRPIAGATFSLLTGLFGERERRSNGTREPDPDGASRKKAS